MVSSTPDMMMRLAARHHLAGQLREAAGLYRKVLQQEPQHAGALHALGVMAHQTGRDDAAEKLLMRAVVADSTFAAAHDDLGALWLLQGKAEQAIAAFTEATRVEPERALAHAHLGAALATLGRFEQSVAAYQRAADAALNAVRRLRPIGIDLRPVTDQLQTADVQVAAPALPLVAADVSSAIVAQQTTDTAAWQSSAAHFDPLEALVDAEEDEEGVVGLTLVPAGPLTGFPGEAAPQPALARSESQEISYPMAARASAAGLAYAGATNGWSGGGVAIAEPPNWPEGDEPTWLGTDSDDQPSLESAELEWHYGYESSAELPPPAWPADEIEQLPIVNDVEADLPQALEEQGIYLDGSSTLDRDEATVPMIEPEIGDPRYDGPLAMLNGMLAGGGQAAVPFDDAPLQGSMQQSNTSAVETALFDEVVANTIGDQDGQWVSSTLAADTQFQDETWSASSDLLGTPIELADAAVGIETVEQVIEVAPLSTMGGGAVVVEIDPSVNATSPVESATGLLDEISVVPLAPVTRPPPTPQPKIKLPPSAARLADDPVMATRQLAKELRRARRVPVADAHQAAQLQKQGTSHLRQRRLEEAIKALQGLVALHPNSAKAHRDLGAAYLRADRLDDAIASLTRALELRPRFADAYASLGDVYHLQGRVEDAITAYRQTLQLRPSSASTHSNLLLTLNYQRKSDPRTLFSEHLKWARVHAAELGRDIPPHENDPTPDRRLRIGYVSADFRRHAVGFFFEPLLAARDQQAFEVICYSDVARPDDETERLSAMSDSWRDIRGTSDAEVAEMVRHDKIDILVDLAGHTGSNRLCMFARKPAPVQVSYLGYPNTTGLPTMDYRLTDSWADPLGETEEFHTEQLYRLARSFLCYQPPADAPAPAAPPIATHGAVTFGCFNILAKLTPETLGLWAKIMTVLPRSRLVLKDRLGTLAHPARRRHVLDIFAYHRISADRLELLGKEPDRIKHLESYSKVDIMLDPFPYNGTTTTCESLWMGVPVIALAGNRHASRVGVSILNAVGLPEFVSTNIEGYARSAVVLARDVNRLALLRRTLRQKVAASSLTDAVRFGKTVGQAYREMWEYWCKTRGNPEQPASDTLTLEG